MKTAAAVTSAKLRGGFYTPALLVDHTLSRLRPLVPSTARLRVLEPGVGDGAFIEGLVRGGFVLDEILALDIDESAVHASREALQRHGLQGEVLSKSMLSWSLQDSCKFDVVVGNLPFVRFQFVPQADRVAADRHAERLRVPIGGVANLWLPMLLASLTKLRIGGAFALILPAECFTGVSAGSARKWLLQNTEQLRCDLYPPGSYPDVLQEVVVMSGRLTERSNETKRSIVVAVHDSQYSEMSFADREATVVEHTVIPNGDAWTKLLLTKQQLAAYEEALSLSSTTQLSDVAKFEVAAVTGANAFFSLRKSDIERFDLGKWARPLLARANQVPGLHFTKADFDRNVDEDRLTYLFDANLGEVNRDEDSGVDSYLSLGEAQELQDRYKCRIREPWYAVPYIKHSPLMLSKRCHFYPRAIFNDTDSVTTDTIYRGTLKSESITPQDFVSSFHNSLTLLSAELEGRSFGGGVLELVPSEVGRLALLLSPGIGAELPRLDRQVREQVVAGVEAAESLVRETDLLLQKQRIGLDSDTFDCLRDAWRALQRRRLDRTEKQVGLK